MWLPYAGFPAGSAPRVPRTELLGGTTDKDSSPVQPSGAYAASLLGLSEQVPAKIVFLTDATDRQVAVGRQEIIPKRTTPKNMVTAGRISGLVMGEYDAWALGIDRRKTTL